ncbi:MAG: hypothetical protein C0508_00575 [Cyanobacteria bacterium PR.023]|nr:hypothetical protein [Cyanobacteria bacterium PR.023]
MILEVLSVAQQTLAWPGYQSLFDCLTSRRKLFDNRPATKNYRQTPLVDIQPLYKLHLMKFPAASYWQLTVSNITITSEPSSS